MVSPATVQLSNDVVVQVFPPGLDVTVYFVTAEPPLLEGADQLMVACALPADAEAAVGAPGTVAEEIGFEVAASESPLAFTAMIVKV